jgi:hypothetical protein
MDFVEDFVNKKSSNNASIKYVGKGADNVAPGEEPFMTPVGREEERRDLMRGFQSTGAI